MIFSQHKNRWEGIIRPYDTKDVFLTRTSIKIEHTLAKLGAEKLWGLFNTRPFVRALGSLTGGQAVQMEKAGLQTVYVSGYQVAADGNLNGQTYPDQSLYSNNSVPYLVRRINNAFIRADQLDRLNGGARYCDGYPPVVADAEAGFGGPLHAFELMKMMIEAGAAGVHFEDQLATEKKCGHLGGKCLLPASRFILLLIAARLAADVLDIPTILIARTDAEAAPLLATNIDPLDRAFIKGKTYDGVELTYDEACKQNLAGAWTHKGVEGQWIPTRTSEGFYSFKGGLTAAIARGLAYAPYADLLWMETKTPDFDEAKKFADAIHNVFPNKRFAYNCSPSIHWKKYLNDKEIAEFQNELGKMGYVFPFITLAGIHTMWYSMYDLAKKYNETGMSAYVEVQEKEFAAEKSNGYTGVKHQSEVGTPYFDFLSKLISSGQSSTLAMPGSTEQEQFV